MRLSIFLALLAAGANPVFGGIANCSVPATIANTFAGSEFGSSAAICGNVSASSGVATIDATTGTQLTSELFPFIGVSALSSSLVSATDGSALRFNFAAAAGLVVSFQYQSTFELGVDAFSFVVLDGDAKVLDEFSSSILATGPLSLSSGNLTIATSGNHSLAFGIANGCPVLGVEATCVASTSSLDPTLTVQDITLSGTVPEPASLVLVGAGVLAIGLFRRKR